MLTAFNSLSQTWREQRVYSQYIGNSFNCNTAFNFLHCTGSAHVKPPQAVYRKQLSIVFSTACRYSKHIFSSCCFWKIRPSSKANSSESHHILQYTVLRCWCISLSRAGVQIVELEAMGLVSSMHAHMWCNVYLCLCRLWESGVPNIWAATYQMQLLWDCDDGPMIASCQDHATYTKAQSDERSLHFWLWAKLFHAPQRYGKEVMALDLRQNRGCGSGSGNLQSPPDWWACTASRQDEGERRSKEEQKVGAQSTTIPGHVDPCPSCGPASAVTERETERRAPVLGHRKYPYIYFVFTSILYLWATIANLEISCKCPIFFSPFSPGYKSMLLAVVHPLHRGLDVHQHSCHVALIDGARYAPIS